MNPLPLSRIAQWTHGRLQGGDGDVLIDSVFTDTRAFDAGDGRAALFIALRGDRFDGNDHVPAAAELGARAALVSRPADVRLPQIVVADTRQALAAFAAAMQHGRAGRVIGITGSNGKTGVKQMLLSILQRIGNTYANPGNRNNEIGLPLAVLDAPEDADYAIYEMGAGQPGDIAWLTAIARPQVSLVNNIAPAHLQRMGSLLGVADTKAAIYDALPVDGTAVINADDAFAPYFAERAHGRRLIRFGLEASAEVTARQVRVGADGSRFVLVLPGSQAEVALPLPGRHNVRNALAAAALAFAAADADATAVAAGLAAAQPVAGRLVPHRLAGGALLIDDSYNANPGSLIAAIETLTAARGDNWLVLGDMAELGADAEALHAEIGRRAKTAGVVRLYALGQLSAVAADAFGEGARRFDTHAGLVAALRADLAESSGEPAGTSGGHAAAAGEGASVRLLVKGSRSSAMERVVSALLTEGSAHAA